ncbi:hypothetical protein MTO96_050920 [Rhipicephalus appendiculatus]
MTASLLLPQSWDGEQRREKYAHLPRRRDAAPPVAALRRRPCPLTTGYRQPRYPAPASPRSSLCWRLSRLPLFCNKVQRRQSVQRDDAAFREERQGDDAAVVAASSEPLDASFPIKKSWSRGPTVFVATLLAFGALLVVIFVASQLLQARELGGDEPMVTAVVRQPLVHEPSSGYAYGEDAAACPRRLSGSACSRQSELDGSQLRLFGSGNG